MKYILFSVLLVGCASQLPKPLNTTREAERQDRIINGADTNIAAYCREFSALNDLQEAITPTNLTLRHNLICNHVSEAVREWDALCGGKRCVEGYGYAEYIFAGIRWYNANHFPIFVLDSWMKAKEDAYSYLVAPDGDIPLPEVRAGLHLSYKGINYTDSSYLVRVWKGGYLLVCLNPDPNPRFNLHHFPEAGNMALWVNGKWVIRIGSYTGFQNDTHQAGLDTMLPAGSLRADWRLFPPKIQVTRSANKVIFEWYYDGISVAKRVISWGDSLVIVDNGKRRAWAIRPYLIGK
jgi:hypothetical protein